MALLDGSANMPAELVVAQWQEDLPAEFIVLNVGSEDLAACFDSQAVFNIPAEFVIRRSGLLSLPAEFVVLQGVEDLHGEFIARHAYDLDVKAEFLVGRVASADLLGEFTVRQETSVVLPAGFDAQATENLLGTFIVRPEISADLRGVITVRHAYTGSEVIIAYDPSAFFNYSEDSGTGFLSHPQYGTDTKVRKADAGQASLRSRINYAPDGYDSIQFGWRYRNPVWGEDTWPGTGLASQSIAAEFLSRHASGVSVGNLAAKFFVMQPSGYKELKCTFTVNALASVVNQLRDITDADGWWQNPAFEGGSAFLLIPNASGTLTVRSAFSAGSPAFGGGTYGTNKSFIPTPGNPVIIEWEVQCNSPVPPGSSNISIHSLGGLADGRDPFGTSNGIHLYYNGDTATHVLELYEEGVASYHGGWTVVDITDKTKYKIIWEHPDDVAPNGRVRVYVNGVLQVTETTVVPETELCFLFGVILYRNTGTPVVEATLHSISEL